MRLVLASNNAKKLAELDVFFAPLGLSLIAQGALGVSEAEEPHRTFIENALLKARHAARQAESAAIADDSGLCVDALGGAPGVISAHFAAIELPRTDRESQRELQDAANNRLLLERLHGVSGRHARYVSTLVAIRSADDPEPLIAVGRWEGEILQSPRGAGGFGYDPLMFISELGLSAAELDADVKNIHSHRAIASRQMLAMMREVWRVG